MGDDYYAATAPHSEQGVYINFMAGDDQNRIKANYKGITTAWSNLRGSTIQTLFHLNQNLRPWEQRVSRKGRSASGPGRVKLVKHRSSG